MIFIILRVFYSFSFLWSSILISLWLFLVAFGSFNIRSNFFLKAKHYNYKVNEAVIALTFDDGPNKEFTPKVLQILSKYNAKATFFLIGNQVEENSELIKEIINEGHTIGNHTYTHTNNFGFLKTEEVISDLEKTNSIVEMLFQLKLNLLNITDKYWMGTKICQKKYLKSPQWLRSIKTKKRPLIKLFFRRPSPLII